MTGVPDGFAAVQRDLDRLENSAERNLRSSTKGNAKILTALIWVSLFSLLLQSKELIWLFDEHDL